MPQAERERFLANIARETAAHPGDRRPHDGAHRAGDAARAGAHARPSRCAPLLQEVAASAQGAAAARGSACIVAIDSEAPRRGRPLPAAARASATCWTTRSTSRPPAPRCALALHAGRATAPHHRARPRPRHSRLRPGQGVREVLFAGAAAQPEEEHRAGPGLRARRSPRCTAGASSSPMRRAAARWPRSSLPLKSAGRLPMLPTARTSRPCASPASAPRACRTPAARRAAAHCFPRPAGRKARHRAAPT